MAGVVLVHGAWHGAWCWSPVVEELERRGMAANAVELPLTGFEDDVRATREATGAMGPDAILVGHSYGGLVISEAAVNMQSVTRLVYVTAFLTEAGEDATAILVAYGSPIIEAVVVDETGVRVDPAGARELFYGDTDDRTAAELIARLRPMPLELMVQKSEPAWKSIPSTYVVCTNDLTLPPKAQRWMASRAKKIVEIDSDHSPFLTRASPLADALVSHLP